MTSGCSILGQASAIVQVPMPHKAIQQPAVSWLVTTNNEHLDLSANGVYLQYSHFHGGFGGNPTRTPLEGEGGGVPLFLLGNPGMVIQPLKWNCKVTFSLGHWSENTCA